MLCSLHDAIIALSQELYYISFNIIWMCTGIVTFHWFAILRHQKLLEVPAYIIHFEWRIEETIFACKSIPCRGAVFLEEFVKRFFIVTIDFYLLEQLEVWNKTIPWPNILDAIEDFSSICSWFLQPKLIAREAKHHKVLVV